MAASSAQSDPLYAIAVYHPLPGKYKLAGDYDLPRARLAQMDVDGVPVTLEHAGIHEAITAVSVAKLAPSAQNVGAALDILGDNDPHKQPVGLVLCHWEGRDGRWYCLFSLGGGARAVLLPLVRLGALRGVSLTHVYDTNVPLELSMCVRPPAQSVTSYASVPICKTSWSICDLSLTRQACRSSPPLRKPLPPLTSPSEP